jgi:hypothetical protein
VRTLTVGSCEADCFSGAYTHMLRSNGQNSRFAKYRPRFEDKHPIVTGGSTGAGVETGKQSTSQLVSCVRE